MSNSEVTVSVASSPGKLSAKSTEVLLEEIKDEGGNGGDESSAKKKSLKRLQMMKQLKLNFDQEDKNRHN